MRKSGFPRDAMVLGPLADAARMTLSIPDRDGVVHEFPNGVRGQESVWLDLQFEPVACTAEEDMARQEYALTSDLAYQVQRFGVGHHAVYGEQDFDLLDMTRAFEIVRESQARWLELPKVIRDRYQSWSAVEKAAQTGELDQLLRTAGVPAGSSGGAPAVPPSDSAAETPPKAG